jgi:hypothetical protein
MANPRHGGEVPISGTLTPRKLDPALLAQAEQRLAALDGQVWATARYEDNAVRVRLNVAIPYDEVNDRAATHAIDLVADDGSAFEAAFQALIEANLPRLLSEGRRAAAKCLLAAESAGELEV